MSAQPRPLLALDIGGTKIAAALVGQDAAILARAQMPTPQEGPTAALPRIAELLQNLLALNDLYPAGVAALGIGIPAVLEPETDRVIWAPNIPGWLDVDLRGGLQDALGLPVFVEYDGHTAVLGEWWAGAGQGVDNLVDIIIGTGIGGGIIMDGRLLRGRDRLAGAVGWFAFSDPGAPDDPAARQMGQWEAAAAGPGIARRAAAALRDGAPSVLQGKARLDAADVFAAARSGDALATAVVAETTRLVGLGVANVVSLVNPDRVILGGSVGAQGDLLLPGVRRTVAETAQPISGRDLDIVASTLITDAALLGAAYAGLLRLEA